MIWKAMVSTGAAATIAAVNIADASGLPKPQMWDFFGYPFEAGGMIAAVFGCLMARLWLGSGQWLRKAYRVQLDLPVSSMVLALSAAAVIWRHPDPLGGLMIGAGVGMLGEGVFKLAEKYGHKWLSLFGADDPPAPPAA